MPFDRKKFSASRPEAAKVFVARTTGEKLPVTEGPAVRSEALRRALVEAVDAGEVALAAQDARSAAGAYDVGHGSQEELDAARRAAGRRKPRGEGEAAKESIQVRLTPALFRRFLEAAEQAELSMSSWLRKAGEALANEQLGRMK